MSLAPKIPVPPVTKIIDGRRYNHHHQDIFEFLSHYGIDLAAEKNMAKKKIGRFDRADFPELDLEGIKVKVDTGAYTSCLYATGIHARKYKGKKYLYFKSLSPEHPSYHGKTHRFSEFTKKAVKSSTGKKEDRYFIDTTIVLFGEEYPVTLSLADRRSMRYPVLLGRRLIRNNFIVDVNRSNISLKKMSKVNPGS